VLRVAASAEDADVLSLGDRRAPGDLDRAEVQERHGEAVGRLERDRASVLRQCAGEAHDAGRRRGDGLARLPADVDATMLTAVVLTRAQLERAQDLTRGRPAPGPGGRTKRERRGESGDR
jgi:hypothetical protein